MRIKLNTLIIIFWFFLSWGLIVASKFNESLNQVFLKIVVPFLFIALFFIEKGKLKFNLPLIIYIIFTIWAGASIFYTVNKELTLKYLQTLVGNILLWYLTFRFLHNFFNKNLFFLILGSAFFIHAFFGIFVPPEDDYITRIQGIYDNPNALGFAMWYGLIIFSFFYLSSKTHKHKLIILTVIIFLLRVLIFSASRKSFLAAIVSIAVILFYVNFKNFKKFVIIMPVIFVTYFLLSDYIMINTPLGERFSSENIERGTDIRGELISEGITFFIEHPFIGIGLGSFTSFSSSGMMAHNDYIEVLSSTGIVGFLMYIFIFWIFFKQTNILLKYSETFFWGVICRAFLVGYLILGMGRPAFLDPLAILVFAAFQGMVQIEGNRILAQKQLEEEEKVDYTS